MAGISHYHLSRDGETIRATVYGAGGTDLATCTLTFTKTTGEAECDLGESGRYRWSMDRVELTVSLEDLVTGDLIKARFHSDPPRKGPIRVKPGEEPQAMRHWITIEEGAEAFTPERERYGELVGAIAGEVMMTLDIRYPAQGASLGSEAPSPGIQGPCVPPDEWVCQTELGWDGYAQLQSESVCCSVAAQVAERSCELVSDRPCCANSLCNKLCFFDICNCNVTGYPWECQLNPCI
ncbi:MAG: hypothetical protein AAF585_17295 [Verrucomicrobiota bacterium]